MRPETIGTAATKPTARYVHCVVLVPETVLAQSAIPAVTTPAIKANW
jgi:hypothetical protein